MLCVPSCLTPTPAVLCEVEPLDELEDSAEEFFACWRNSDAASADEESDAPLSETFAWVDAEEEAATPVAELAPGACAGEKGNLHAPTGLTAAVPVAHCGAHCARRPADVFTLKAVTRPRSVRRVEKSARVYNGEALGALILKPKVKPVAPKAVANHAVDAGYITKHGKVSMARALRRSTRGGIRVCPSRQSSAGRVLPLIRAPFRSSLATAACAVGPGVRRPPGRRGAA